MTPFIIITFLLMYPFSYTTTTETGRQRGFGHIDFNNAETAARAVKELDGLEVMGRQLRADHAEQKKKSGGGGGSYGGKYLRTCSVQLCLNFKIDESLD
jgi:RNA recognition motif-containing protein